MASKIVPLFRSAVIGVTMENVALQHSSESINHPRSPSTIEESHTSRPVQRWHEPVAPLLPGLTVVIIGALAARFLGNGIPGVSALVAAVVIGAVLGNVGVVTPTVAPGVQFAARRVLRVGIVLLGLRLSIGNVLDLGPASIGVVAVTVGTTFFGTQWMGRRLGLSRDLSLLVATGYSICGASAIAAVEGSTDAEEEEVAAAIGLVTLFGSLAIFVLPLLAGPLGLTDVGFGTWAGASIHDVAQVVATASTAGPEVLGVAVVVKLTRIVLLAPIVAGVNIHRRATAPETAESTGRPPLLPLFVAGFLAMVVVRTTGVLPGGIVSGAQSAEGWLLTAALVGLGAGVRIDKLRQLGPKPLVLGTLAWVLVAAMSYGGSLLFVQ